MKERFAIILAGGSGTRLWPLSRTESPKQLLKLIDADSLLQATAKRLLKNIPASNIFSVTHKDQRHEVTGQLHEVLPDLAKNVFAEPLAKNTLPAIAWMVQLIAQKNPQAIISVFPSDHFIAKETNFHQAMETAFGATSAAKVVLFGIPATQASTDYGYIECQAPSSAKNETAAMTVKGFVEKPDRQTAENYLKQGHFYWNGGIFFFQASVFLNLLKQHQPEIGELSEKLLNFPGKIADEKIYRHFPSISIDHGLMEKISNIIAIPAHMGWNDLGNWESLGQLLQNDASDNLSKGNVVSLDSKHNIFWSENGLIATLGVENFVITHMADVTMVCARNKIAHIKDLLSSVQKSHPQKTLSLSTETRPWGSYTTLLEKKDFKVKKIVINPACRLSEQMHHKRSEHWIVTVGEGLVQTGNQEKVAKSGDYIFIPREQKHRMTNRGSSPVEIIEVQIGSYLGEDDIVRFQDDYGRL